jgi:ribonuclease-3
VNDNSSFSVDLEEFQNIIGIDFKDLSLLIEALSHSSLFSGNRSDMNNYKQKYALRNVNYEKLEFLGDAVLDLIIAEHFYLNEDIEEHAKEKNSSIEGTLTNVKKVLVENESLVPVAHKVNLGKYILYNKLENVETIFPEVIEAIIGAIYLDRGLPVTKDFVNRFFDIESALEKIPDSNPVGKVQDIYGEDNVHYRLLKEGGPAHSKTFTVGLQIYGSVVSRGEGTRIKKAEAEAARKHLRYLKDTNSLT